MDALLLVAVILGALAALIIWQRFLEKRGGWEPSTTSILGTIAATSPSARTVRPEEVFGTWSFYVDAVASTVAIDLLVGGHYTQTLTGVHDAPVQCPGGAWTLVGPHLELTSYRSATRATTEKVRWFFADHGKELVLIVKDDPLSPTVLLGQRAARKGRPAKT